MALRIPDAFTKGREMAKMRSNYRGISARRTAAYYHKLIHKEEPINYRQVRDECDFACATTSTTAQIPPGRSRDIYLPPRLDHDGGGRGRNGETSGDLQVGVLVDGLKRGIDGRVGGGLASMGITNS